MDYKEVARHFRHRCIDVEWQIRAYVRGYGRYDQWKFLRSRGERFKVVRVNDYRMQIDLRDNVIAPNLFLHGNWEPYESELLGKLLRPGMTFVDVGAHIGYYSLLAAGAVGPTGRIFAFEPSPDNFKLLQENIRLNGFGEIIRAENAALSEMAGEVSLYLSTHNTGDHRIYATLPDDDNTFNAGAPRSRVQVSSIPLDQYLTEQGISRVDVIKIDVQGAEMVVLRGMKRLLVNNSPPVLLMEFWPHGLRRFGTEPRAVLDFLTNEIGFSLFHIKPMERRVVPIEAASFSLQTQTADPLEQIDLIACPRNSAEALEALGS